MLKSPLTYRFFARLSVIATAAFFSCCGAGYVRAQTNAPAPNELLKTETSTGWIPVSQGAAHVTMGIETNTAAADQHPQALRLSADDRGPGIANPGAGGGIPVKEGEWYDLTFEARTETNKHFGLIISIESSDGHKVNARATLPEVGGEWNKYTLALQARRTDTKNRLVITMPEPGTIWFDHVSLIHRQLIAAPR